MSAREGRCVIIGAGPAGLSAAYELARLGRQSVTYEASDALGGLSRTFDFDGYLFDVGGHRFFSKVEYVRRLWREILGDDLLERSRLSRIYYRGRFFHYPLRPWNAFARLGPLEALRVGLSYARVRLFPIAEERTFEQWVSNRFGRRLYELFFKSYTEKVWGIPCSEISSEWAAQRIKNLDLPTAVRNALFRTQSRDGEVVVSLIDRFHYPRLGPGQMWTRCAELVRARGSDVQTGARVIAIRHARGRVESLRVADAHAPGGAADVPVASCVSSMPLRTLLGSLDPAPPAAVLAAAGRLRYRDFLTVGLIVDRADLFPDNWLYIHSDEVRVGRIQNTKNWSPDMVPDPSKSALGLEYFVQENDELWSKPDAELVALARSECAQLGLVKPAEIERGVVLRARKAYPVYSPGYREALDLIRAWLGGFSNLAVVGRNGQHRYNNQDHSMMTGVLAARNIAGERNDVWAVNVGTDYHEELRGASDRLVPQRIADG